MFLDGIDFATRRLGAALLIGESNLVHVLVGQGGRHPDVISILTDPHVQKVAVVVVLRHMDLIPDDSDLVSIALRSDVGRRGIKGVRDGEDYLMHDDCIGVADDIDNIGGNPTVLSHPVHIYIEPDSDRGATINGTGVAGLQVPRPQIRLRRAPKACCQGLVHSNFGEIEGGRWGDGGGGREGGGGGGIGGGG